MRGHLQINLSPTSLKCAENTGLNNQNRNRDRYRNRNDMTLGHEKLDVYRLSIGYVAWVYKKADNLRGSHRHARDQWLRAANRFR